MKHEEYLPYVAYRCVVGSTAYRLNGPNSDLDKRGFYVPPTSLVLSLNGVPEQIEDKTTDQVYWELHKYIKLCLASNPNILDTLYTDMIELGSEIAFDLRSMRDGFLSKKAYYTYTGYAHSQIKLIQNKVDKGEEINWKNAMHLVRLMLVCYQVLREGTVMVDVGENRSFLLDVKNGRFAFDEIVRYTDHYRKVIDRAFESTLLPDEPEYERANEILLKARKMAADY